MALVHIESGMYCTYELFSSVSVLLPVVLYYKTVRICSSKSVPLSLVQWYGTTAGSSIVLYVQYYSIQYFNMYEYACIREG